MPPSNPVAIGWSRAASASSIRRGEGQFAAHALQCDALLVLPVVAPGFVHRAHAAGFQHALSAMAPTGCRPGRLQRNPWGAASSPAVRVSRCRASSRGERQRVVLATSCSVPSEIEQGRRNDGFPVDQPDRRGRRTRRRGRHRTARGRSAGSWRTSITCMHVRRARGGGVLGGGRRAVRARHARQLAPAPGDIGALQPGPRAGSPASPAAAHACRPTSSDASSMGGEWLLGAVMPWLYYRRRSIDGTSRAAKSSTTSAVAA